MNKYIEKKLQEVNILIALNLAKMLSSMNFFWICSGLIITAIVAPAVAPQCSFIAQTIIQLLALPVLGLAQDIQSTRIELKIDSMTDILKNHLEIKIDNVSDELKGHICNILESILSKEEQEITLLDNREN